MRRHPRAAAAAAALFASAWGAAGWAEPAGPDCAPSFEHAQELRARGERMAAREELVRCAAACPDDLRRYCVTWLAEVEAELGSVVLVARRAGADVPLSEVRVVVDGLERRPERGRLVLEPGTHRVELHHGGERVARTVVLEAGREPTSVVATFGPPAPPPPQPEEPSGTPVASWVLIGFGGAALIAALALAVNGHVERSELVDSCAPACAPDSIVPIERQWIASGVLAGAGAALLVTAGIVAGVGGADDASVALTVRQRF